MGRKTTSAQEGKPDLSLLKLVLAVLLGALWLINQFAMDREVMESVSGASSSELNYWGTKAAGFALIAASALFVALIPAKWQWVNFATGAVGGLAAVFSGYYWLEETTSGKAGGYIVVVVIAGIIIATSVLIGPAIATIKEKRSGNADN
ncbi:MAG: hypothetical protein F4X66_12410 [Chloroflexi bacterium]|nr:hypothetical protein [Chloroflexota bacterium]MYE38660.1 hypothetical protein [Chloroflexota bacterium]